METSQNTTDFRRQEAIEKVERLKGFYTHFTIYLIFVPIFISINYFGGSNFPWAIFPIVGWGIGVAGHATETFGWNPFFGKDWERRKIEEFMEDDNPLTL
tara:strand:- start:50792 stop:51091 length:300 start_codon:yes stop_codon:yes gene_type:complete